MINNNYTEKMERCKEYIEALEEERRKIQVFQRELPLCLELVTQAIDTCKQQLSGTTTEYFRGESECSEQTSSDGPVLEEFIPIKRNSSSSDEDHEEQSHKSNNNNSTHNEKISKKSDWLRSVQLWNQSPDEPIMEDSPRKVEVKRNGGGAFHPFKREKSVAALMGSSQTASTTERGGGESKKEEKEGQLDRKARRCWSPELHRRFLHALKQLGGCHVATPKQIRELMKVDGLTNDEVKSHLQKYRLHTRRPSPSIHNNHHPQAPQFVVVGGIWVPPPATTTSGEASGVATPNGIYAPIAAPLPPPPPPASASQTLRQQHKQSKQMHSDERGSPSEGGVHSNSPATSSSTHTTTASPAY
uniref:Putative transcription factor GLK2 n=1 Tax=Davidia involucrata TaxID=16924 RepID=A0A5B7B4E8_DAVIN